jgi:hypothetical protein
MLPTSAHFTKPLEEVWIIICHINEQTTNPHIIVTLVLYLHSWNNNMLVDMMHFQVLTEDDVATTNWNSKLLYCLMMIRLHDFLHLSQPAMLLRHLRPGHHLFDIHCMKMKHPYDFHCWFSQPVTECDVILLLKVIHIPSLKPTMHCTFLWELLHPLI